MFIKNGIKTKQILSIKPILLSLSIEKISSYGLGLEIHKRAATSLEAEAHKEAALPVMGIICFYRQPIRLSLLLSLINPLANPDPHLTLPPNHRKPFFFVFAPLALEFSGSGSFNPAKDEGRGLANIFIYS